MKERNARALYTHLIQVTVCLCVRVRAGSRGRNRATTATSTPFSPKHTDFPYWCARMRCFSFFRSFFLSMRTLICRDFIAPALQPNLS